MARNNNNKMKVLIVGITSQDGAYLARFLVDHGHSVDGLIRRVSTDNQQRLRELKLLDQVVLIEGDITDPFSVSTIIRNGKYDEIYNLAAMSEVHTSFKQPHLTFSVNTTGVLNILEAIKDHSPHSRFYQAGTSEQFGTSVDKDGYQRETTPFLPRSPYAVSKVAAFDLVRNYRESYGLFAANGILFNHTSPLRGYNFVERKISRYVGNLYRATLYGYGKLNEKLKLGNLDSYRDFGHSHDYVIAMYQILKHGKPDDFVVATGETVRIGDLVKFMFEYIGKDYKEYVVIDPNFVRPAEVPYLRGDSSKIKNTLMWAPQNSWQKTMTTLLEHDMQCPTNIQF